MKAFVKLCALIVIFSVLCIPIVASSVPVKNVYTTSDVEISFNDNCPDVVANKVINAMSGSELSLKTPIVYSMSNFLCIFGHSHSTGTITRTYHSVYSSDPRCKAEYWYYDVCSRGGCDYAVYTLEAYSAVHCH